MNKGRVKKKFESLKKSSVAKMETRERKKHEKT